jgi:hypothetical protein
MEMSRQYTREMENDNTAVMACNAVESGRIMLPVVNSAASIFRAGDGGSGQKLKNHIKEDIFLKDQF